MPRKQSPALTNALRKPPMLAIIALLISITYKMVKFTIVRAFLMQILVGAVGWDISCKIMNA